MWAPRRRSSMNRPETISALSIRLPQADRSLETYKLSAPKSFPDKVSGPMNRIAFSAAHVVADPLADADPWLQAAIDWDKTIAYRERLWDLGLGVAEAMDTAQRGMGLDWPTAHELARRTLADAGPRGARVVVGIATDQLPAGVVELSAVRDAYLEQLEAIESAGGEVVLMASRHLAAA